MYRLDQVKTIHLEITSKCNASCPMCLRNVLGGKVNPHLPLVELSLADMQKVLPLSEMPQLNRIFLCGNYGDPIMGRETLEILKWLRDQSPLMHLEMFTNGSGRSPVWWQDLAKAQVQVRFSVDGLADTNHIYRRGTKFPLIERSMRAFLEAGGRAEWDFIVFRHNEHQIEAARQMAKELGFHKFNVKKTARFFSNQKVAVKTSQEVQNQDGEIEYYLEQPLDPRHHNSALKKEDEIVARFGSLKDFFGQTPIDCKTAAEGSLYISSEGLAFPCCWTANQLYPWYYPKQSAPIWRMIEQLPQKLDSLNAKINSLKNIVEGPFFQRDLPASWDKKGFDQGRLFVCGKTCGRGFDSFSAQFQSGDSPRAEASRPLS